MSILVIILIIVVTARAVGELMERLGQSSILGELLAGIILGFLILSFPQYFHTFSVISDTDAFKVIRDLGILFIMVMAGLEMRLGHLAEASKVGLPVALGGIFLPFSLGYLLAYFFIPESDFKFAQAFFIGVSLSITAIPVSVRVLMDLKQLNTKLGHTIVSAAVIDDIFGLILLAILTSVIKLTTIPSGLEIAFLVGKVIAFFVFAVIVGKFVMPYVGPRLSHMKSAELQFTTILVIALIFGALSEYVGMHFSIGAFIAGVLVEESTFGITDFTRINRRVSAVTFGFLAPFFFASIGLNIDISAFSTALGFTILLIVAAIIGKMFGCGIVARLLHFSRWQSFAIGIGMNGRGAVELVVAAVALTAGLFEVPKPTPPIVSAIYSSVVIMAFITTLLAPIGLKLLLRVKESKSKWI